MSQTLNDLIIVGGGVAACSALKYLAQYAPADWKIIILTGPQGPAAGLGYSVSDDHFLLNASHGNMSLSASDPHEFSEWLRARAFLKADSRFVSRDLYGGYVRDAWAESFASARARGLDVRICQRNADRIESLEAESVVVSDEQGTLHTSARALICEGPLLQAFPVTGGKTGRSRVISPLWPSNWTLLQQTKGHVVIIGTGLSALDATSTLLKRPEVSQITMISTTAQLPRAHVSVASPLPIVDTLQAFHGNPSDVFIAFRKLARLYPWQDVMDALRPVINDLWTSWTQQQRHYAVRHFSQLWTPHRNRVAGSVLTDIDAARQSGRLTSQKGNFTSFSLLDGSILLRLEHINNSMPCDWLVDARGYVRVSSHADSFCGRALSDGYFTIADIGYGVACSATNRATSLAYAPIHVVGASRFGDLIETTGVPEVRTQVRQSLEALICTRRDATTMNNAQKVLRNKMGQ